MLLAAHWTGNVDPVAFTIGDIEIAWYGIIITCAMLTGLIVAILRGKKQGLVVDDFVEIFLIAIPLAIIGARIGYVMVRPEYFPSDFTWDDFVNVIAVWDGGLTIMTGVPFGILGGAIWCKIPQSEFVGPCRRDSSRHFVVARLGQMGKLLQPGNLRTRNHRPRLTMVPVGGIY